jgi:hypothetical protein
MTFAYIEAIDEWLRSFYGIDDFEVTGQLVERAPDVHHRDRLVLAVPGDPAPLAIVVTAPEGLGPPFAVGDAITVQEGVFSPDETYRPRWSHVRMLDGQGRLRWAFESNEKLDVPLLAPELATVAERPACRLDEMTARVDLGVSLRGVVSVAVAAGVATGLEGQGDAGRLYVTWADRPICPPEDAAPADASRAVLVIDAPGPVPAECRADGDCGPDQYCERGAGPCNGPGRCLSRPTVCWGSGLGLKQFSCGCDGQAYDSPCRAHVHGTDVSLADDSACAGLFRCGWFSCDLGHEACLSAQGASGAPAITRCVWPGTDSDFPIGDGCDGDAVTCACFDLTATTCTCTEPAPGEVRIACD